MILPNHVQGPPGGWRYKVPETGQSFAHVTEQGLLSQLRAHYKANDFNAPADLASRLEHYICEREPEYCVESDGQPPMTPGKAATVAYQLALHGTRRLLGMESLVPQAQANARATTCSTCVENVELEGCTSCNLKTLTDIINTVRGKHRTPLDPQLRSCRVCLCGLEAKVWLPLDRLQKMTNDAERAALPPTCWMITEAQPTTPVTPP